MEGKLYVASAPHQLSDSNRRIIETDGRSKRVYQVWPGRNRFCLGGRFIFGPDATSLPFTVFLIVTPVIVFCSFVSPQLITEFDNGLGQISIAVSSIFTAYILCILFMTSGRDPGIIPRNSHPPEPDVEGNGLAVSTDWVANQGNALGVPPTKDVLVNGLVVKVKYCQTCMLYRPPRCSHCSICNNCVDRFDHHCPWVGQCIGKRNYRYFFMFVSSTTTLCIFVFAFCSVNMKKVMEMRHCNLWRAFLHSAISGILIIYTFIAVWFVGGLTAFHLYLVCTNQTTYENFRYRYGDKMNPNNRGCWNNIKEIFCTRIPPSKNDFMAIVKEDSPALPTSLSLGHVLSPEMAKTSFDIEMGGKRQPVLVEEFEDIQNQIGMERCGTEPRHSNWGEKGNWEITADIQTLAAEFVEQGFTDREKIYRQQ